MAANRKPFSFRFIFVLIPTIILLPFHKVMSIDSVTDITEEEIEVETTTDVTKEIEGNVHRDLMANDGPATEQNDGPMSSSTLNFEVTPSPILEDFPVIVTSTEKEESEDITGLLTNHIIEKDGLKYLDISSVKQTELKFNLQKLDVVGVTAVDVHKCIIEQLIIVNNTDVDRSIADCQNLKKITFLGTNWKCANDWTWLDALEKRGVEIESSAVCWDVRKQKSRGYVSYPMDFAEGIGLLQGLGIKTCPKKCKRCVTLLTNKGSVEHRVDCHNCTLIDDDIAIVPLATTSLYLEENRLKSTHKIFSHLKHLENLTHLNLGNNILDAIPFLKENYFLNLKELYLQNNDIRKVDVEAFESIISREDISVDLRGNAFHCDCDTHFFLKLCLLNAKKVVEIIKDPLRCLNSTDNFMQLITLRSECEPWQVDLSEFLPLFLVILLIMNGLILYIVYDLIMAIRDCKGTGSKLREPKLHIIVTRIGNFIQSQRVRINCRSSNENRDNEDGPAGGGLVTLRIARVATPSNRDSPQQINRRRLTTPCPN